MRILLVAIILLAIFLLFKSCSKKESIQAASVATIQRGDLRLKVIDFGILEASHFVEVRTQVDGRVEEVLVKDGDVVRPGELIAKINPREAELKVNQAKAELQAAELHVKESESQLTQLKITVQSEYKRSVADVAKRKKELEMQPELTEQTIQTAESSYHEALNDLELLEKIELPSQKKEAESHLKEAEATHKKALAELERQKRLFEKGYIAKKDLESAQHDFEVAKVRLEVARQKLTHLKTKQPLEIQKAKAKLARSQHALQTAKAGVMEIEVKRTDYQNALTKLEDAKAKQHEIESKLLMIQRNQKLVSQQESNYSEKERALLETSIKAPAAGRITKVFVRPGELVTGISGSKGGHRIVRIEGHKQMMVKLLMNQIDASKIRVGIPATIKINAFPEKTFHGIVQRIGATSVETAAKGASEESISSSKEGLARFEVEVHLQEIAPELKSGMSAKCTLIVQEAKNVLYLPLEYVGHDKKGYFIMLSTPTNHPEAKPKRQPIQAGMKTAKDIEILSGAKEGEKVMKPPYQGPEMPATTFFGGS